jgi:hypothetical protein
MQETNLSRKKLESEKQELLTKLESMQKEYESGQKELI